MSTADELLRRADRGTTATERGYSHGDPPGIPEEMHAGSLDTSDSEGLPRGRHLADPETDWQSDPMPDEPTWTRPARTPQEAYVRAYTLERFWRQAMRPPYRIARRTAIRKLRTDDLIRTYPTLVCRSCGENFARRGRRGPVPTLCDSCALKSRNR